MNKSLILAGVVALGLSSTGSFAQDTSAAGQSSPAQNSGTAQTGNGDSMGMSGTTSPQTAMPSADSQQPLPNDGTTPGNRRNSDYGALDTGTADTNPGVSQPPTTRNADTTETRLPLKGANSFTQAEAIHRLERAGYTQISGLAKDDQSVWRGVAMKGDQQVAVGLDYKGNITDASK